MCEAKLCKKRKKEKEQKNQDYFEWFKRKKEKKKERNAIDIKNNFLCHLLILNHLSLFESWTNIENERFKEEKRKMERVGENCFCSILFLFLVLCVSPLKKRNSIFSLRFKEWTTYIEPKKDDNIIDISCGKGYMWSRKKNFLWNESLSLRKVQFSFPSSHFMPSLKIKFMSSKSFHVVFRIANENHIYKKRRRIVEWICHHLNIRSAFCFSQFNSQNFNLFSSLSFLSFQTSQHIYRV